MEIYTAIPDEACNGRLALLWVGLLYGRQDAKTPSSVPGDATKQSDFIA